MKPRARTADECRVNFQRYMLEMCRFWANAPHHAGNATEQDRMEGLCHSIQCYLDGRTQNSCGIDLVLRPRTTDKAYHVSQGENWFKNGMVINDTSLSETFFQVRDKLRENAKSQRPS